MFRMMAAIFGVLLCGFMVFPLQGTAASNVGVVDSNPGEVIDPSVIELPKSIHFTTPEGNSVVVPAGSYSVEQGGESQLRFSSSEGAAPIIVAAVTTEHDFDVAHPLVLGISGDGDSHHIVLLQPGGKALDAAGSASEIRTRAPITALGKLQIAAGVQTTVLNRPGVVAALGPLDRFRFSNYVITPSNPASLFGGCTKPAGWVSAAIASSQVAPAGSTNPVTGPGRETGVNPFPPGTPWNRGAFPGYFCSNVSVTVSNNRPLQSGAYQLLATSYIFSGGVSNVLSMFVTDVYQQQTGAGNTTITFPQVVAATGRMPTPRPGQDQATMLQVDRYYSTLPTGAPVKFELKIDGVTWAEKHCLFKGYGWPQAPTLKCQ